MRHCSVTEQGYPRVGQACSQLAHTGTNLVPLLVIGIILLVAGFMLVRASRRS